jgi:sugar/nucleoside kinase (ribokinase family)
MDIVGVGLNATDTLIPVSRYPASGSKVEVRSASVLPGGQVASAMVACQRWGLRARYVGKLGDDSAADLHRAEFRKGRSGSQNSHRARVWQPAGFHSGGGFRRANRSLEAR